MDRRRFLAVGVALAATAAAAALPAEMAVASQEKIVPLPEPDRAGGKPLMACLDARHTNRAISGEELALPVLSNILWAAWGINRDNGRHVIPTARNRLQITVYAVCRDGVWRYLPDQHAMRLVLEGDRRSDFDGSGLILLYAAPADDIFAGMHVGSMYQNVGLYCASANLANCVKHQRHDVLDSELDLPSGWRTWICHSIGKPRA